LTVEVLGISEELANEPDGNPLVFRDDILKLLELRDEFA
jgi:hypothetical protein